MIQNPLLLGNAVALTPVRHGGATGRVGEFGMTRLDIRGKPKMHNGIDLLAIVGWPVFAAHAGRVDRAGWENPNDPKQGYGLRVWIVSDEVKTVYAHLSKVLVEVGNEVEQGDLVGIVGQTGNTDGAPVHLHFEVHIPQNGAWGPVDPSPLLRSE